MKVVLAQTNPSANDFDGNVKQILCAIDQAKKDNADLVMAPEMAISGYLCKDSMLTNGFAENNLNGLKVIINASLDVPNTTIIVGYVEKNNTGIGKPLFNSAAVIKNGFQIANYRKHLLPFYDVFDEGRYFESGKDLTVVEVCRQKFGMAICEDCWQDKMVDVYRYDNNPVDLYRKLGIKNILSINSSPYIVGKPAHRRNMLQDITRFGGLMIYVNQTGGMDDLIFDGNSMVVSHSQVRFSCDSRCGSYTFDTEDRRECNLSPIEYGTTQLRQQIVTGLGDYIRKTGFKDIVVASSGGIDSALVLCLACEAIGAAHVHAIRMPSIYSSKGSVDDALALHQALGCHDYLVHIDHVSALKFINKELDSAKIANEFGRYSTVADENIQARLRAINLMHFSNCFGALALTTGNKSENATGYCTLGGDMMGGYAPIQDLYKTQVYDLSKTYEAIPETIINKAPSAELAPEQTDESALLPYGILDLIIYAYVELRVSKFSEFKDIDSFMFQPIFSYSHCNKFLKVFVESENAEAQYSRIIRMIDFSEFKRRQAAPGIKVSKVAFGSGRRFPIVNKQR